LHQSFFFSSRRRHTRFSRDWSSDVCSFRSSSRVPFSHAVATAYYWSTASLGRLLEEAGFEVLTTTTRPAQRSSPLGALLGRRAVVQGTRPHGAIVARRR